MKHIKIAAGLAHVNYGNIAGIVREINRGFFSSIILRALWIRSGTLLKLMGGHQIIAGIRPVTDKPIECHIYTVSMDRMFIVP